MKFIRNILESQLCMLKAIVEDGKIAITFHGIWVIQSQFSLIDVQSFLLVDCGLQVIREVERHTNTEILVSKFHLIRDEPRPD